MAKSKYERSRKHRSGEAVQARSEQLLNQRVFAYEFVDALKKQSPTSAEAQQYRETLEAFEREAFPT